MNSTMNKDLNSTYYIDLAKSYGIDVDNPDSMAANEYYLPDLPSIEQIAFYNLAANERRQQERALTSGNTAGNNASAALPQSTAPQTQQSTPQIQTNSSSDMSGYLPQGTVTPNCPSGMCGMGSPYTASGSASSELRPIEEYNQPFPITAESIQYLNGFIRSQVGRYVTIEFLVGTNLLIEKEGFLIGVGANFILLNERGTSEIMACDFYNIKFITFHY